MQQTLAHIALVVDDYDRAIDYYTGILQFELIEDTTLAPGKRWVLVKPKGNGTCNLLLARASNEDQRSRIGNQTGDRVFLFLHTDNFDRDYEHLRAHDVEFIRGPREMPYGKVAVFSDLYGNLWDLIQPTEQ